MSVDIAVAPAELAAMEREGPRTAGPLNFEAHEAPVDGTTGQPLVDGTPSIRILVTADTAETARWKALEIYGWMREDAQLPPSEARVLGTHVVHGEIARAEELWENSYTLTESHQYEMAVITTQMACELEVRAALESKITSATEPLSKVWHQMKRQLSLNEAKVFEAALGVPPKDFPRWSEYNAHRTLRHNIVHDGAIASKEDAEASRDVAAALIHWVRSLARRA